MPPARCTVTTQAGKAVLCDKSKEHHILQSITHSMGPEQASEQTRERVSERVSERERVFFSLLTLFPHQPGRLKVFWNSAHVSPSFDPVLCMQHLKVSRQQRSKKRSPVWRLWISSSWSSSWKAPFSPVCARDREKETLIAKAKETWNTPTGSKGKS